jgi:hypothetical protein
MGTLTTAKRAEVYFDKALETYQHQMQMLEMVDVYKPGSADLQNANNVVWRPVQQHAPVFDGFDLSTLQTGIIEESYPAILGEPANDFFELRVDDLRDMQFWERRGEQSGLKQATTLNQRIAQLIVDTGSLFYRVDTGTSPSGYVAISQGQAILNERQKLAYDMRYVMLNDRDTLTFGADLAARQTLQGRPEDTWKSGQIGRNVAQFDVFTGSFLPQVQAIVNITETTLSADLSDKPEAGSVDVVTSTVTNVDYRISTLAVVASADYRVGDRVTFINDPGGADISVDSVGLADKTVSGQPMTAIITAIPDGTSLQIFPKLIAPDDPALSTLEKASSNISTQVLSGATVVKLNIAPASRSNIFWCKESVEVFGGSAPIELLNEFGGQRVISSTMTNGQEMWMAYDGDIDTLTFKCRLFTWYGLTNKDPSANGVFVTFT